MTLTEPLFPEQTVPDGLDRAVRRVTFNLTYAREERSITAAGISGKNIPNAFAEADDEPATSSGEWDFGDVLGPWSSEKECLQTFFEGAIQEGVHEVLEWFRVDGKLVVNPHGKNESAVYLAVKNLARELMVMSGKSWAVTEAPE